MFIFVHYINLNICTCFGYIHSCTVISRYLQTLFYVEELTEVFNFRGDTDFLLKLMSLIGFFP